jgi:DNA-binding NtrC family response regulator
MGVILTPSSALSPQGLDEVRILVTDDQPEMLLLIDRALGSSFECEFASNVDKALQRLEQEQFALAICSLDTGLPLAEEIAQRHPGTATVVLTTRDNPEAARRAFNVGVYGYLVEPFSPGQLLITVMNSLRRRELEIAAGEHARNAEDRHQEILDRAPVGIYAKDR